MRQLFITFNLLLKSLFKIYIVWIAVLVAGRLVFLAWLWPRLADLSILDKWAALLHGWRMDNIALSALLIFPLALLTITPSGFNLVINYLLRTYVLIIFLFLIFLEVSSFPFFAEYDSRPNIIFVQYLAYPKEILSTIFKSQISALFSVCIAIIGGVWIFIRQRVFFNFQRDLKSSILMRLILFLPFFCILALGFRSSLGHRPANISDALYSSNRIANEIAKNSLYSISYEQYLSSADSSRLSKRYGHLDQVDAYARVKRLISVGDSPVESPFMRPVKSLVNFSKPKNLVIIVEESLGARFVGFTGGEQGLTPSLDALAQKGVAFTNLFSNGTRSIQGLAAVTSGFQAIPGEGVLKRANSQHNFFTIAYLLKQFGYHSSFIYGGEARFDNMKAWYLGNGFDEVIEQKDFINPSFTSSWGVSDEDLLLRANDRFQELHDQGRPFVAIVFSTSNHEPFELPEGRIEWLVGEPHKSVKNAVRYADYALGKFFASAEEADYFNNTVFLVIADHDVRVYGDGPFPIESFRIPAVIFGDQIAPLKFTDVTSQPDTIATALHLLGLDLRYPILGNSIFNPARVPFVLMKYNDQFGFLKNNKLTVLTPGKSATTWTYSDRKLLPIPLNRELSSDGIALLQISESMYHEGTFQMQRSP